MKIIMISTDRGLFQKNSHVQQRIAKYGKVFDQIHIIIFSRDKCDDFKIAENVYCYSTNSLNKFFYITDAILRVKKILSKMDKKDVLVSSQDPFETGVVACISKFLFKIKFQCQIHIDFFSPYYAKESFKHRMHVLVGPYILKHADSIRVVSKKIQKYITEQMGIVDSRVCVLPVFTDTNNIISSELKQNLKEKYKDFSHILLIASRLVKQKGILYAVEAFEQVIKQYPKALLLITGSGPEESVIKKYVADKGLNNNVAFEPWTNDLTSYMKTCDAFLLPSLYEGWGLTVVEAASCGKPVIMTDVGCANEFIINNQNGVIVPVADVTAFAQAIIKVLSDDKFRDMISSEAVCSAKNIMLLDEYLNEFQRAATIYFK